LGKSIVLAAKTPEILIVEPFTLRPIKDLAMEVFQNKRCSQALIGIA
jgi:hypothetical protein